MWDVSLAIAAGDFVAITGPSGCGKTTLLGLIGLLDRPTHGSYLLDGNDTSALSASARATLRNAAIGFVFQSFNLIGEKSILANVAMPLALRGMRRVEREDRAAQALERVDMLHRARHLPAQLSGGQQQRVAIARAIVGGPRVVLADEPTGNLDSVSGAAVLELLTQLHTSGVTICMVTHDEGYAARASRQVRLHDGLLVDAGLRLPSFREPA